MTRDTAKRAQRCNDSRVEQVSPFEWRADAVRWRWMLLGTLGLGASACSAQADGDTSGLGGASVTLPPEALLCATPVTGLGGNWERCANGILHRRELGECPSALPRARVFSRPFLDDESAFYGVAADGAASDAGSASGPEPFCNTAAADCCFQDSDCTAAPHGRCEPGGNLYPIPYCTYGCVSDSECGPGRVCLCGDPVGTCIGASCSVDRDCGDSLACTQFERSPGCPNIGFACQTADDACVSDGDCSSDARCSILPSGGARSCRPMTCTVGRPFLVDGRARLALAVERADWYPAPDTSHAHHAPGTSRGGLAPLDLDAERRAAVRQGWLEQALMEHASVAAFARFALELLSLGAPAELAQGAAAAMLDEIGHARECFGLARRFSDTDLGPGPLPLDGALESHDLESIVIAAIEEGCVGETVAALEAAEALAHCADPDARRVLEQISRDETEHARLAWRFVSWALGAAEEPLRRAAERAFRRELEREAPAETAPSERDRALLRCGLLPRGLSARLRRRVVREVVAPCAEALLLGLERGSAPPGLAPSTPRPSAC